MPAGKKSSHQHDAIAKQIENLIFRALGISGDLHIVEHFGGYHDAGDEEPVDVEGGDEEIGLAVDEAVEEDVSDHET
jgi:hypothetical protein